MSKKQKFGISAMLSKGFSDTISLVESDEGLFRQVVIPLERLETDPNNPRKLALKVADIKAGISATDPDFKQKQKEYNSIKELSESIKLSGLINPITIYKHEDSYRIIAGERRYLASMMANKQDIEARVLQKKPGAFELKLIQWFENNEREDLSLFEQLMNIRDILLAFQKDNKEQKLTSKLLAELVGLSAVQANKYMMLIPIIGNAKDPLSEAITKEQINSLDKAFLIAKEEDPTEREKLLESCISGESLSALSRKVKVKKEIKDVKAKSAERKSGRVATRVSLGYTTNPQTIKTIVEAVLKLDGFGKYKNSFSSINWHEYSSVTQGFKELIGILEKEKISETR